MKTLAERLAWARNELNMSQQQLADKSRVAQSTIGGLESGSRLSARRITAIASALGVNSLWLVDGRGPVKGPMAEVTEAPRLAEAAPPSHDRQLQWLSPDESELLSDYRACGPVEKSTSAAVLKALPKVHIDKRIDQS